jgi:hypothetical protein
LINDCECTINHDKGKKMAERNNKQHDKGSTVHIDAETMKKIEEYQAFIRKNHPEMPVPTKGQMRSSATTGITIRWGHGYEILGTPSKRPTTPPAPISVFYEEIGGWGITATAVL